MDGLMRTWWLASHRLGAECPIPITQGTADDTLLFAWDNGRRYVDVETTPEGRFYWYFRDRETGEISGTSDDPVANLEAEFFDRLRAVVKQDDSR